MALNRIVGIAGARRPCQNETACGDDFGAWAHGARVLLMLADGLGHGPLAAQAAQAAMDCLASGFFDNCEQVFAACDRSLASTRGAAVTVAIIDREAHTLSIATVGNTRALLVRHSDTLRFGGERGIVGANCPAVRPETISLVPADTLLLFSDGIDELADLASVLSPASIIDDALAKTMLHRWGRQDDDASILLYRFWPEEAICTP